MAEPVYEKMSKSRGNVVTIDEVVHGVRHLDAGLCFVNTKVQIVDYHEMGVWRDMDKTGCYFTSTRSGKQKVFLCDENRRYIPFSILFNDEYILQHEDCTEYWNIPCIEVPTDSLCPST